MSSKINCKGKTFVLTGIRTDKEEKLISDYIMGNGGIIKSSTVLTTDYLTKTSHTINGLRTLKTQ